MDWIAEAIKLKKAHTWDEIAVKVEEMTGERYTAEKVRSACRRRIAKLEETYRPDKEGYEEYVPQFEEENEMYTISTGGMHPRTIQIHKDDLRNLKRAYCTKPYPTMNECARKMDIPRQDFYVILKAFRITHNDVPFIDEDLVEREIEDLAFESLEQRKQQYFDTLDRVELRQLRKEVQQTRKQEYLINMIRDAVNEDMVDFAKTYKGPGKIPTTEDNQFMLEVPIVDLHLGKLGWAPETGENYDYKIARQRYSFVMDEVVSRASQASIEKILFPISNDFFHFDTLEQTTSNKTPMDSDMRWPKLYSVGMQMFVKSIDALSEIAPIDVLLIPGNHDRMTGYYAIEYLYAWYRNIDHVNVHVSPMSRKYFEHGNTLIGYSHGDKEKGRIAGNMQVEAAKAWGRTKYREWHLAHEHSESSKELAGHGIIIRRLSSITGPDLWHADKGYVGSIPKQQCFLWDKETGLHTMWYITI